MTDRHTSPSVHTRLFIAQQDAIVYILLSIGVGLMSFSVILSTENQNHLVDTCQVIGSMNCEGHCSKENLTYKSRRKNIPVLSHKFHSSDVWKQRGCLCQVGRGPVLWQEVSVCDMADKLPLSRLTPLYVFNCLCVWFHPRENAVLDRKPSLCVCKSGHI